MIEEIKCENIFCLKIKENIKKDDFLIVNNIGKNMLISDCEELKIGDSDSGVANFNVDIDDVFSANKILHNKIVPAKYKPILSVV